MGIKRASKDPSKRQSQNHQKKAFLCKVHPNKSLESPNPNYLFMNDHILMNTIWM